MYRAMSRLMNNIGKVNKCGKIADINKDSDKLIGTDVCKMLIGKLVK